MNRHRTARTLVVAFALLGSIALEGCASRQSRNVEQSGFLGDYSQLEETQGKDGQPRYIYKAEGVDWGSYDKVHIESVQVLIMDPKEERALSDDERKALAGYLFQALSRELSTQYELVASPGPGVLHIRCALTEADGANVMVNSVTSILPQTYILSNLVGLTTDAAVNVGQGSLEMEVLDGKSGKRLAAAMDRRVGAKNPTHAFSKWADVESAFDYWAERTVETLWEWREES